MKDLFDLDLLVRPIAEKVIQDSQPVTYGYGNVDALMKWIETMNKKQIEQVIGIGNSKKYPLIWLVEGWNGEKGELGTDFNKVVFHISVNSNVTDLNESREPNFKLLFDVFKNFEKQLKYAGLSFSSDIGYTKRANFSVTGRNAKNKESHTIDVWDTLIIQTSLRYYGIC